MGKYLLGYSDLGTLTRIIRIESRIELWKRRVGSSLLVDVILDIVGEAATGAVVGMEGADENCFGARVAAGWTNQGCRLHRYTRKGRRRL